MERCVRTTTLRLFDLSGLCLEPSFISEESFVRAPLNSRVVSGATSTKSKGKAKEESLDTFPLEVQEAMILEDILYVLMVCDLQFFHSSIPLNVMSKGIEGAHITYHEDYSPEDDDALQGIRFSVSKRLGTSNLVFSYGTGSENAFRPIVTRFSGKGSSTRYVLHCNILIH